jgi:hypothetical protein
VVEQEHGRREIDIIFRISNLATRIAMVMVIEVGGSMEHSLVGVITIP